MKNEPKITEELFVHGIKVQIWDDGRYDIHAQNMEQAQRVQKWLIDQDIFHFAPSGQNN